MAGNLDELRALYPEFDEYGYTDSQVLDWVGQQINQDPMKLAEYYGLRDPDQGDFTRGMGDAWRSTKALAGGLVGLAGDTLERNVGIGEGMRDYGIDVYQRNMDQIALRSRDTDTWENVNSLGDFADFAQYYSGYAAPQAVEALLSGGVGALVGKQVVKQGLRSAGRDLLSEASQAAIQQGARRGSLAGIGTQAIGSELGATYGGAVERAEANGGSAEDVDLGKVYGYGTLAGLAEFGTDVATLGLARVGPAGQAFDMLTGNSRVRNAAARGLLGAGAEGITEGVQTGLEDLGAGATMEEARFFDPTSVAAGAIGGGQMGVIGGLRRPANTGTNLNPEEAARRAQEEAQLQAQDAAEAQAQEQQQLAQIDALKEARLEARQTFMGEAEFMKQREKARLADVLRPETETGQAFRQWQKDTDNYENDDKTQKAFLKDFVPSDDQAIAKQEYLDALDRHAANIQQATAVMNENPELATMPEEQLAALNPALQEEGKAPEQNYGIVSEELYNAVATLRGMFKTEQTKPEAGTDATAETAPAPKKQTKKQQLLERAVTELGEDFEVNYPELSQLAGNPKSFVSRGKGKGSRFEAMLNKIVAEKAAPAATEQVSEQPAAPADPIVAAEQTTPPVEPVAAPQTPAPQTTQAPATPPVVEAQQPAPQTEMDKRATAYAVEKLGEDFAQKHPQVAQLIADKKYAAVQTNVDRIATQTSEEANKAEAVVEAFSQPTPTKVKLSGNEQKVFDVLMTAFKNNEADTVLQADGKWNTAKIGELAGVGEKTANTYINRMMPKIAKQYGFVDDEGKADIDAIRTGLRESGKRRRNVEAYDPNAADQQIEMTALGESMSTKASANQGARDGMSAEDAAFLDNMEETPNRVQSPEEMARIQQELDAEIRADAAYPQAEDAWNNGFETDIENEADRIAFSDMDAGSRFEFLSRYVDYARGEFDLDALGGYYDDIRAAYIEDTQNADTQAIDQVRQIEGGTGTETTGPDGGEVRQEGTDPEGNQPATAAEFQERAAKVKVETKKRRKIDPKKAKTENPRFGLRADAIATATPEAFDAEVKALTGESSNVRVHVFANEAEAIAAIENGDVPAMDTDELVKVQPYGWVQTDDNGDPHAHFILDRIPAGGERAAFMHEVGGHVGIDSVLNEEMRTDIARQIADWAKTNDGSLESKIANRALQRMDIATARGGVADEVVISEAIAYFLEEATLEGVTPDSKGPLGDFVRKIYDAFLAALTKLGLKSNNLTAQDIVDMAYGAARLELVEGSLDPTTTTAPFKTPSMGVNSRTDDAGVRYGVVRDALKKGPYGKTTAQAFDDMAFLAKSGANSLKFLHQFIRDNKETMPSAGRWYNAMLEADKTRNDIRRTVESIATQARNLSADRLDAVNDFIGKSTFYQKWGYDPQIEGRKVKIDPLMAASFKRLNAAEQQLVKDIFQHGENMRQRKQNIAKQLGVQGKFFSDAALDGPYAPLKRFGNFAGELKSKELLAAERAYKEKNNKINREKLDKLKSDPAHYQISFFDTMGAARRFADENSNNFEFAVASERAPDMESDRVSNPEVFEKILGALGADSTSGIDADAKKAFGDMVRNMYFQSLDERSARQSGARRMNRAGYEKNMVRSFLSHARAEAALIANMEHGAEINTAFAEANNEARKDPERLRSVYAMIARHYKDSLSAKETPIQDRIAAMNSVYMLTTSVGYHVTNATQPAMVTIPRLAADFRDYSGAWGALTRGYKVAVASATMGKNLEANIDIEKAPPKYRKLLEELQQRQLLDVGMEEDLSEFDRFNTGYEPLNQLSDKMGKIVHKLYQVARFVEAQNRISAAVAAYDMALANPDKVRGMKMTAAEYATAVVEDTQGNFSRLDAPLLIKQAPLGKLTTQYRKYQLMMAWNYASAFRRAVPYLNKDFSKEEVAVARRTLALMVGHAGLFAGATGVPLMSTIAPYILAWSSGEDEPQDLERWIRENIDDGKLGDVLSRGFPAFFGIDMSTKLSQDKIFDPLPYVDLEASENFVLDAIVGLGGPVTTTLRNFGRSAEYATKGDYLKAIEYAVPKGIRTAVESYRLATEGFTLTNGDVVVDPRDIDVMSLLVNALGIPSTEINHIKWTRGQQYELEQYFTNEQSRMRREYIRASDNRDRAAMQRLRLEWRELQAQKDRVRPFFGNSRRAIPRQTVTDLIRAPRAQDRREQRERERFQ